MYDTVRTINADNVNEALASGLWALKVSGIVNDSRNGRVLVAPAPVITTYNRPEQRVLFSPLRDANPFFHLFEAIWMMAGRNDVAKVAVYAKQMESFADDDGLQWGAYGFRWRNYFAFDQLTELLALLRRDPKTRRAVLTMWAPNGDLVTEAGYGGIDSKDVPCNTQVYFDLTMGSLNMTVCNRSNDIVWGAYGANCVHMSFLQEFMARQLGVPVGSYHQFSNNFHAYLDRPDVQRLLYTPANEPDNWNVVYIPDDRYRGIDQRYTHFPIVATAGTETAWLQAADEFCDLMYEDVDWIDPFFNKVAAPMMRAHRAFKLGDFPEAYAATMHVEAPDWSVAAFEWLCRRQAKVGAAT